VAGIKGSGQGLFLGLIMGSVGKMNVESAAASEPRSPSSTALAQPHAAAARKTASKNPRLSCGMRVMGRLSLPAERAGASA
jgi:hypothetical protein